MRRANRNPLRRVVNHDATRMFEGIRIPAVELECGHLLAPPEDRSGRRYPERMRCRMCSAAIAASDNPESTEEGTRCTAVGAAGTHCELKAGHAGEHAGTLSERHGGGTSSWGPR